jgi:hypothetical protein
LHLAVEVEIESRQAPHMDTREKNTFWVQFFSSSTQ